MSVVPGTKVQVNCFSFGGPPTQEESAGKKKQQPHLYYSAREGKLNLASVNAGNSRSLDVGGGGINSAFEVVLSKTQTTSGYWDRHMKLLAKADAAGSPQWESYSTTDPCAFSYVDPTRIGSFANWYGGVCFVDVFDPNNAKLCPDYNLLNIAMVYVAPPDGANYLTNKQDVAVAKANFLIAIEATAAGIVKTVSAYNALATRQKLPVIQALRNCLFSSGIYDPKVLINPGDSKPKSLVDPSEIALTIFKGFTAALQKDPDTGLEELQFPVGNGKIYQDDLFLAVQQDLAQASKGSAA